MLIEFKVKNFRSVRDEMRLSMVASTDRSLTETNVVKSDDQQAPNCLRTAVLYGANASGKTNFVRALIYLRAVVVESATIIQLGQKYNVQPFQLDRSTAEQPSEFEITFSMEGVRYQYGFALTTDRVTEEWLLVYRSSKAQQWFTRKWSAETDEETYEFSSHLTGQKKLWQETTRPNALFLSTAVQLNSERLKPVYEWIANKLVALGPQATSTSSIDLSTQIAQRPEGALVLSKFLSAADISIAGIEVIKQKGFRQQFQLRSDGNAPSSPPPEQVDILVPRFRHVTAKGEAFFQIFDESEGTQRLYMLAGLLIEILRHGHVLIVDELDSSLHPLLVRKLVELFQTPSANKNGAQLIFTTHNTTLLDQSLFRRDQIWLVEKTRDQASALYPLTEFSPRIGEALEDNYLMGRYGGVPMLHDTTSWESLLN